MSLKLFRTCWTSSCTVVVQYYHEGLDEGQQHARRYIELNNDHSINTG